MASSPIDTDTDSDLIRVKELFFKDDPDYLNETSAQNAIEEYRGRLLDELKDNDDDDKDDTSSSSSISKNISNESNGLLKMEKKKKENIHYKHHNHHNHHSSKIHDRTLLTETPNIIYRFISSLAVFALQNYYRNVYVSGIENVPKTTGCILAANHWNNAIDIGSILAAAPRKIHFWSKQELFTGPKLAKDFMLAMGCLPVQRNSGKSNSNDSLFVLTKNTLQKGGIIAIFPEGTSHNMTKMGVLKDGCSFASLQYAASTVDPEDLVPIIPAGITYEPRKYFWRQNVHVRYGRPIDIKPFLEGYETDPKSCAKKLTNEICLRLKELTINADSIDILKISTPIQRILLGYRTASMDIKLLNHLNSIISKKEEKVEKAINHLNKYQTLLKENGIKDEDLEFFKHNDSNINLRFLISGLKTLLSSIVIGFYYIFHLPAVLHILKANNREKYTEVKAQTQIFASPIGLLLTYIIWYCLLIYIFYPYVLNISPNWVIKFRYITIFIFLSYTFPLMQDWWNDNYLQLKSFYRIKKYLIFAKNDLKSLYKNRNELKKTWLIIASTKTPIESKKEE